YFNKASKYLFITSNCFYSCIYSWNTYTERYGTTKLQPVLRAGVRARPDRRALDAAHHPRVADRPEALHRSPGRPAGNQHQFALRTVENTGTARAGATAHAAAARRIDGLRTDRRRGCAGKRHARAWAMGKPVPAAVTGRASAAERRGYGAGDQGAFPHRAGAGRARDVRASSGRGSAYSGRG